MTNSEITVERKRRLKYRPLRRLRAKLRETFAKTPFLMPAVAYLIEQYIRFVHRTNRLVEFDTDKADRILAKHGPLIITCWHGQHFMMPLFRRNGQPAVAMVSRSRDAELNALIIERMGIQTVRASGGRKPKSALKKGAVSGILALRNHLKAGTSVFMMADIPHGKPRQAGMGIVSIARMSGAPIVPVAYASSRRRVLENTWDKSVINLPFGQAAFCFGDPIHVPSDADDAAMEAARLSLEGSLNGVQDRAYACVDGPA